MIHQYKLGGYNIVLDVCSGAVHVVDDIAYDLIAAYDQPDVVANVAAHYPDVDLGEIQTDNRKGPVKKTEVR